MPLPQENRVALALFLILMVCSAYFLPRWADWNQNSRLDQVMAIVDRGVLHIDDYYTNTGDYAFFEGHYYSDKAPGVAFLGVPVYAAMRAVVPPALVERLSARLGSNDAIVGTLRAEGSGLLTDKVYAAMALYAVTVVTVSLPSALGAVALFYLAGRLVRSALMRAELGLAYGLATVAFPYSQAFMGHQLAAACAVGAFALLAMAEVPRTQRRRPPSRRAKARVGSTPVKPVRRIPMPLALALRAVAAGFLLGYGLITEYPALFVLAPVGVYALWRLRTAPRAAALLLAAAALPVAGGALYNWAIFHTPLPVAYRYSVLFPHHFGTGFMGFTRPSAEALWGLTFSPYRGLFFYSPVLLLALPGFVVWRRVRRLGAELAVAAIGPAVLLVFLSGMATWAGGNAIGPRHLTTALPFLMLPIAALLGFGDARLRTAFRVLALFSGALVWLITLSGQAYPPESAAFPLRDYALPLALSGDVARNVGTALGLAGWQSAIPLLILLIGGYAWLRRESNPRGARLPRGESRPTYGSLG